METTKYVSKIGVICLSIGASLAHTIQHGLKLVSGRSGRIRLCCNKNCCVLTDPYVKVWLTFDGRRVRKQKTRYKQKTLNPIFDERFTFEVASDQIALTCLSVVVMDHDIVGHNDLIGRIALGRCSGPTESQHWNEMLSNPQQTIERWHVLKNI